MPGGFTYKFKSHPTTRYGIRFRSRLEARWATFFTALGWPWSYEPVDIKGWVPDFILSGGKNLIFVEVKPILLDDDWYACAPADDVLKYFEHKKLAKPMQTLVVGLQPFFNPHLDEVFDLYPSFLGLLYVQGTEWTPAIFCEDKRTPEKIGFTDIHHQVGDHLSRVDGRYADLNTVARDVAAAAWAQACNETQWHAPRRRQRQHA